MKQLINQTAELTATPYQKRLDKITHQIILDRTQQRYDAITTAAALFESSDPEFYELCKEKAIDCLSYITYLKEEL